jgi:hypothetical protein
LLAAAPSAANTMRLARLERVDGGDRGERYGSVDMRIGRSLTVEVFNSDRCREGGRLDLQKHKRFTAIGVQRICDCGYLFGERAMDEANLGE